MYQDYPVAFYTKTREPHLANEMKYERLGQVPRRPSAGEWSTDPVAPNHQRPGEG